MSNPVFLPRLSEHPIPERPLVFQCPLCKELTKLQSFQTSEEGLAIQCQECMEVFFYTSEALEQDAQSLDSPDALPTAEGSERSFSRRTSKQFLLAQASVEATPPTVSVTKDTATTASQPSSAPKVSEPEVGKKRCPKCSERCSEDLESCPSCGLLFANVGKTFVPSTAESASTAEEKGGWKLWATIEEDWQDELAHEAFVKYCITNELYDFVSIRYRGVKDAEDERQGKAEAQLGKIVELVQQQFFLKQETDKTMQDKVGRWKGVVIAILLVLGFLAFLVIWRQMMAPSKVMIP
ncbi:MAG: hypothetical protein EP343_29455 [Deltaproteobacteria bacterium]|nr:MAG: hypothetical protein EP343_29455 [Deltaproteobacteria bacterium]